MPKYKETFKLGVQDIAIIENALRNQVKPEISLVDNCGNEQAQLRKNNREILNLLGKINHQKIFYSEVNDVAHPRG